MKKKIICNKCLSEIRFRYDLIVATDLWMVKAYHSECYSDKLKTQDRFFIGLPLNTTVVTVKGILVSILCIPLYFISSKSWDYGFAFLFIPALVIFYRLYSWFKYERHFNY